MPDEFAKWEIKTSVFSGRKPQDGNYWCRRKPAVAGKRHLSVIGLGWVAQAFMHRQRVLLNARRRALPSRLSVSSMCSKSVKKPKYCWR